MSHTSSARMTTRSESSSDRNESSGRRRNLTVDQLFPSETNKSGTKGKRLNVDTLFSGVSAHRDVVIDMSHEVLIERKKKRKEELEHQYLLEYKRCWKSIGDADNDTTCNSEIVFEVLDNIPDHPDYSPWDCVETIQSKLRTEEFMNTHILGDGKSIFISWKDIETNRDTYYEELEEAQKSDDDKEHKNKDPDDPNDNDHNNNDHAKSEDMRKAFDIKIGSFADPTSSDIFNTEKDTDKDN
jgi:hypothetical protein